MIRVVCFIALALSLPVQHESVSVLDPVVIEEPAAAYTDEDRDLLALVCMAEAEGECEEGKRLVIDTVLNRVESDLFPGSVHDVLYQKSQFSSMWNGRANRCHPTEEFYDLVDQELEERTDSEVLYFTALGYSYGTPYKQVGNHYFCKE